jgi:hypothetical protein
MCVCFWKSPIILLPFYFTFMLSTLYMYWQYQCFMGKMLISSYHNTEIFNYVNILYGVYFDNLKKCNFHASMATSNREIILKNASH